MNSTPHCVEQNIENFLDNFKIKFSESPLCSINNNTGSATYIKSPTERFSQIGIPPGFTPDITASQLCSPDTVQVPPGYAPHLFTNKGSSYLYTQGHSGTYYNDGGLSCWRYSWSMSESTASAATSPWGSVSEASSALGTFEHLGHVHRRPWDYVMGESSCTLTVLDVADALQSGYMFISEGRAPSGHPIITFPDSRGASELTDEEYKNIVTYLTSIPPLHDIDLGFVVVVDRRHDKWSAVKSMLNRLSGFFPGLLQEVLVLRPSGFFQKTVSDMGFKFIKDDFKFQVVMYNSIDELHSRISKDQLTEDLGGTLSYNHQEWIQHRAAIEKFSASTSQIGQRLREVCHKLQLTEFPNDVISTESLIRDHEESRSEVKDDLSMTLKHGEILLGCIKTVHGDDGVEIEVPSSQLPCNKLAHITAVERLLVQLEETKKNFDVFWQHHEHKLKQCLLLRQFEDSFRRVTHDLADHVSSLSDNQGELGESAEAADELMQDLAKFEADTMDDVQHAETLRQDGERFIDEDHYAVDCIRPKCLELQRICEQYKELLRKRQELLAKSKELHDRIERASQWCSKGIDLLSSQMFDQNSPLEGVNAALRDLDAFINSQLDLGLNDPTQVKVTFDDVITPEMKVALEQILQRMEDVRTMCDQKRHALKKLVDRPPRPVQTVEPHSRGRRGSEEINRDQKQRWSGRGQLDKAKTIVEVIHPEWELPHLPKAVDSDSDSGSPHDELNMDTLKAKRRRKKKMQRHVMRELIETEKHYVSELNTIIQGYCDRMDDADMLNVMPPELCGQKRVVFGNMQEILNFHQTTFLKELESCRDTPALVGHCFVARKEEFQMYSDYCQNKIASDSLRQFVGEDNDFFKVCQRDLNHPLPLGAYLLKPVQRITKYQLLLKEMFKYSQGDKGQAELEEAIASMVSVVKYVNDIMHQVAITGYAGSLPAAGRLLMQGSFSVWRESKKDRIRDLRFKAMQRHIFLYEKLLLLCKKKEDLERGDKASYIFKNSVQMSQVGLTENIRGDKRKFEIWLHGRTEVYTIQAPSMDVKAEWVAIIKKVLLCQFDHLKETALKTKSMPVTGYMPPEKRAESPSPTSTQPNPQTTNDTSPKGLQKSQSLGQYSAPSGIHKSYSSDAACTDSGLGSERALNFDLEEASWSSDEETGAAVGDVEDSQSNYGTLNFQDMAYSQRYVALAAYEATESSEASLREGDMVEILQIGNKGWWFIRNLATLEEGWTPASFLDCAKRASTYSTQSTVSSGSTDSGGGRRNSSIITGHVTSPGVSIATSSHSTSEQRTSISSQDTVTSTSSSGVSSQSGVLRLDASPKTVFISETLV